MKLTLEEITKMIIEAMDSYQSSVGGESHSTMSDGIQSVKEEEKPLKKKKMSRKLREKNKKKC